MARNIKNKILGAVAGAVAAGKNYSSVLSNSIKTNRNKSKIKRSIAGNLSGPGVMGAEKYDTAVRKVGKYVKEGNYGGARSYVKDQLRTISQQTKGTSSSAEALRRMRKMK